MTPPAQSASEHANDNLGHSGTRSECVPERSATEAQGTDSHRGGDDRGVARRGVEHGELAHDAAWPFDGDDSIPVAVALNDRHLAVENHEQLVADLALAAQRFALGEPRFLAGARERGQILRVERFEHPDGLEADHLRQRSRLHLDLAGREPAGRRHGFLYDGMFVGAPTPEQVWAVLANPSTWGDWVEIHQGFAGEAPAQFMPGGAVAVLHRD